MATVHWSGMSGDWSTASDWSTGTVPGPSDRAVIWRKRCLGGWPAKSRTACNHRAVPTG